MYALQFITSDGRIAPHYGGGGGDETSAIINTEDGVLIAFSGCRKSNKVSENQVGVLQIKTNFFANGSSLDGLAA